MAMSWAEHSVEIAAPIETSFDAIVDYESFPGWQDAVERIEVLSRTDDGLGEDVRLFIDAKVRKIDYTVRYGYERPTTITWDFIEGNGMRDIDGVYTLEELGPDRTRATYKLGADPEIPAPGIVLRRTHKSLVKRSVEDLKREAERRHAAGEGAAAQAGEAPDAPSDGEETVPAPGDAGSGWKPKAERRREAERTARPGSGSDPGGSSWSDLLDHAIPVAERPVRAGIDLAKSALRAGRSVANLGVEVGKEIADRVDRTLSGDRRDDDR